MRYFAGLDVSLEETAVCIVDESGEIMKEFRSASEPEALITALRKLDRPLERIGLEACSLSSWLHDGLCAEGLPAICIETRHANATMKTMPNKTDRNDARALAQIMRTGWYRQVHVKSRPSRLCRSLLGSRRTVLNQMRTIENVVRALTGDSPTAMLLLEPLLTILATMAEQLVHLTKRVLDIARNDRVCRQLMSTPGVGPITALAFRATIDHPNRFRRSRDVGAHLGLTPARYQSGETDIQGKVSRCDDGLARTALYEAAHSLLARSKNGRACARGACKSPNAAVWPRRVSRWRASLR